MSEILDTLTGYLIIGIVCIVVIAAIVSLLIFSIIRKRRVQGGEEFFDSSKIERKDIMEYVRLDDIRDGMMIVDGYRRFIAAIEVKGFDYYHAHPSEQARCIQVYQQFFSLVKEDQLQICYYPKHIDFEEIVERYQNQFNQTAEELVDKSLEFEVIKEKIQEDVDSKTPEELEVLVDRLEELRRELVGIEFRKNELDQMIRYTKVVSGVNADPEIRSAYVFDWSYSAADYLNFGELSEEQIIEKAKEELATKANVFVNTLTASGVRAHRLRTEGLIDLNRMHFKPVTGELFKLSDVRECSYSDYVVNSEEKLTDIGAVEDGMFTTPAIAKAYQEDRKYLQEVNANA